MAQLSTLLYLAHDLFVSRSDDNTDKFLSTVKFGFKFFLWELSLSWILWVTDGQTGVFKFFAVIGRHFLYVIGMLSGHAVSFRLHVLSFHTYDIAITTVKFTFMIMASRAKLDACQILHTYRRSTQYFRIDKNSLQKLLLIISLDSFLADRT